MPESDGLYVNFAWTSGAAPVVLTYERFVGRFTEACGTGNCAVGLVLSRRKGFDLPVTLVNRGGEITIGESEGSLRMTGAAAYLRTARFRGAGDH